MRNAKLDKAKRQAVGIYRAASPHASINHGMAQYSGGDYRTPDAAKSCYLGKPQPFDVTGHKVTICKPGTAKGANALNAKRGQATPQNRAHMNTFAFRSRQAPAAIVKSAWRGVVEQTLIPAKR
jgi:hypothetical protein